MKMGNIIEKNRNKRLQEMKLLEGNVELALIQNSSISNFQLL